MSRSIRRPGAAAAALALRQANRLVEPPPPLNLQLLENLNALLHANPNALNDLLNQNNNHQPDMPDIEMPPHEEEHPAAANNYHPAAHVPGRRGRPPRDRTFANQVLRQPRPRSPNFEDFDQMGAHAYKFETDLNRDPGDYSPKARHLNGEKYYWAPKRNGNSQLYKHGGFYERNKKQIADFREDRNMMVSIPDTRKSSGSRNYHRSRGGLHGHTIISQRTGAPMEIETDPDRLHGLPRNVKYLGETWYPLANGRGQVRTGKRKRQL